MMDMYGKLQASLQSTVGLGPVNAFVSTLFADAVGRYALAEDQCLRHVAIDGGFGTGKRTRARLIAQAVRLLWTGQHGKGKVSSTRRPTKGDKVVLSNNSTELGGCLRPGEVKRTLHPIYFFKFF